MTNEETLAGTLKVLFERAKVIHRRNLAASFDPALSHSEALGRRQLGKGTVNTRFEFQGREYLVTFSPDEQYRLEVKSLSVIVVKGTDQAEEQRESVDIPSLV